MASESPPNVCNCCEPLFVCLTPESVGVSFSLGAGDTWDAVNGSTTASRTEFLCYNYHPTDVWNPNPPPNPEETLWDATLVWNATLAVWLVDFVVSGAESPYDFRPWASAYNAQLDADKASGSTTRDDPTGTYTDTVDGVTLTIVVSSA